MSKAQLVITAVVLEGRSKSEVARDYDVSRTLGTATRASATRAEGSCGVRAALAPAPSQSAGGAPSRSKTSIVRLRKTLDKQGFDAGAATIADHLARDRAVTKVPATVHDLAHPQAPTRLRRYPSHRNGPAPHGNASRPTYPTSCGRPMSPTGTSPITPR